MGKKKAEAIIHPRPHRIAGKTCDVVSGFYKGAIFTVTDWYARLNANKPWAELEHDAACFGYCFRMVTDRQPKDQNVVEGRIAGLRVLLHESELGGKVV